MAEPDRYTLIVGMGCPWAHRTLATRAIKGLERIIEVEVVRPSPEEGGWIFESETIPFRTVRDFYLLSVPGKRSKRGAGQLVPTEESTFGSIE